MFQKNKTGDGLGNDQCLDDSERLISGGIQTYGRKQNRRIDQNNRMACEDLSEHSTKPKIQKAAKQKHSTPSKSLICLVSTLLLLLIPLYVFQKDLLRYTLFHLTQLKISVSESSQLFNSISLRCNNELHIFRVYYKAEDREMEKVDEVVPKDEECEHPVYGVYDLGEMVDKWNKRYLDRQIDMSQINKDEQKEQLLILLKLYFEGGVYIGTQVPVNKISKRALKYALTGLEPIFADFAYKNDRGIYVPGAKKFIKVRIPYSPVIREMILKLINGEDFLQKCKQKQCIIVR